MKCVIVVEGKLDELLVSNALKTEPKLKGKFKLAVAGGKSSAISLARSYLASTSAAVAILLDADTIEEGKIGEERDSTAYLLASVAASERFKVVLSVPTIEVVLFSDRALARSIFKRQFTDVDWIKAETSPKRFLAELGFPAKDGLVTKIARLLKGKDIHACLQIPPLSEIRDFILDSSMGRHSLTAAISS